MARRSRNPASSDADWLVATVPGTVLSSYLNAGAMPDPNFGDNQLTISDSFFYADFWYRNEFTVPATAAGKHVWLNFDGINWKADVFLNGEKLGRIEGGFMRGRFDVTALAQPGRTNALAVRIEKNATPGSVKEKTYDNPGQERRRARRGQSHLSRVHRLGLDSDHPRPQHRHLERRFPDHDRAASRIENPFVTTALPLPDVTPRGRDGGSHAAQSRARPRDPGHAARPVRRRCRSSCPVTLEASVAKTVKLDPSTQPALRLANPKLWWPTGYGDPESVPREAAFEETGQGVSDATSFQAGVRQFTYSEEGGALRMWINGRRFIPRGGNWGFGESMLRYRAREYDAAVRYHRDMNFTMIRNWVGQIGEDAFYEACDRYGIVVWQDFWLANPWDGPDPDDNAAVPAQRTGHRAAHSQPSVDRSLLRAQRRLSARSPRRRASARFWRNCIPACTTFQLGRRRGQRPRPVSGQAAEVLLRRSAPRRSCTAKWACPTSSPWTACKPMMPEAAMWPQGRMWGLHDFSLNGAQRGASSARRIEKSYGEADNVADWVALAQFVNYDGYRAMFEAQSKNRMGLLIWMSHPAGRRSCGRPTTTISNPAPAYFGAKKASEPLHIQWNPVTDKVEVVNYSGGDARGLTARVQMLNLDGAVQWETDGAAR